MSTGTTHYDILGVDPELETPEIRKAYLKLARAYHPDNFQDPAERDEAIDQMARINGAWEVLSDADRRNKYDRDLRMAGLLPAIPGMATGGAETGKPSRRLAMLPIVTLVAAIALFAMGLVLSQTGLLVAGVVAAVLAAVFFFMVPLMVMRKAQKDSPE